MPSNESFLIDLILHCVKETCKLVNLTKLQKGILEADGHVLVKGGPGSGKTTVAILKAGLTVRDSLRPRQKVLFLSFARATVARILEAIDDTGELSPNFKRLIHVDTYHAFFWRLIRSHGYLLGLPRQLNVLTPHREAVALSSIRNEYKSSVDLTEQVKRKRLRIAKEEGLVCFDLFSRFAGQLLHRSIKVRQLIANAYPSIILDEFQDTGDDQWVVIQALGQFSELLALADPEQRIFDFVGAHPKRLQHFEERFTTTKFDLSDENHRSKGTQLTQLGNDILVGRLSRDKYNGFQYVLFKPNQNQAYTALVIKTLEARKRLISTGCKGWSLAILVPTKRMTRNVSRRFNEPLAKFPQIEHHAAIDMDAAILAAEVIAYGLQGQNGLLEIGEFITLVCNYFLGKGGDGPSTSNLKEASGIRKAFEKAQERRYAGKEANKNSLLLPIETTCTTLQKIQLRGEPDQDWITVRDHFAECKCKRLREIATEVRSINLLNRGTMLREALSQDWREHGRYLNALSIVRQAFVREHFATNNKPETGIVVMNMHKAKGKQFDEVIIFEGWPHYKDNNIISNPDRIVRGNSAMNIDDQTRHNLRVSITRAKRHTTLLTPEGNPCILL